MPGIKRKALHVIKYVVSVNKRLVRRSARVKTLQTLHTLRLLKDLSGFFINADREPNSVRVMSRFYRMLYVAYDDYTEINAILEMKYPSSFLVDWFLKMEGLSQSQFDKEVGSNEQLRKWMDKVWYDHYPDPNNTPRINPTV